MLVPTKLLLLIQSYIHGSASTRDLLRSRISSSYLGIACNRDIYLAVIGIEPASQCRVRAIQLRFGIVLELRVSVCQAIGLLCSWFKQNFWSSTESYIATVHRPVLYTCNRDGHAYTRYPGVSSRVEMPTKVYRKMPRLGMARSLYPNDHPTTLLRRKREKRWLRDNKV